MATHDVIGFFWVMTGLFLLGGLLPPLLARWATSDARRVRVTYTSLACAVAGSLVSLLGAGAGWGRPAATGVSLLPPAAPWLDGLPEFPWELRVDSLSAFFLGLIAAFALVVGLYSFNALLAPQYRQQQGRIAAAFNLFTWGTLLTVMVNDLFFLIVALEVATLAFAALTLYKHHYYLAAPGLPPAPPAADQARLAPQIYLCVGHTSTVFLVTALLILAKAHGSLRFDEFIRHPLADPPLVVLVFLLALVGLGIRVGLAPAHFWVPLVHPASPTPTHAFSLGVAIKVGLYLMIRCFLQFLAPEPLNPWGGALVLLLGAGTALVGVWYALASHDLKTALAYHSVENIGIMTAGIGVAWLFAPPSSGGLPFVLEPILPALSGVAWSRMIAGLALLAALYHILNHAIFKGLLYLCTGAIDNLTGGIVEFERLGGVLRRQAVLGATFLVGTVAIAGFPPGNGFISEWLTLQALAQGAAGVRTSPVHVIVLLLGLLILVGAFALTALCFVKIAGITLLGAPRDPQVADQVAAGQVPPLTKIILGGMAGLCLLTGLLPGPVSLLLAPVVDEVVGAPAAAGIHAGTVGYLALTPLTAQSPAAAADPTLATPVINLPSLLLTGAGLVGLTVVLIWVRGRTKQGIFRRRQVAVWVGGGEYDPTMMQTPGATLTFLERDRLGATYAAPAHSPSADGEEAPGYLPAYLAVSPQQRVPEVFNAVYNRLITRSLAVATALGDMVQNGDLRRYLLYILGASILALLAFLWEPLGSLFK